MELPLEGSTIYGAVQMMYRYRPDIAFLPNPNITEYDIRLT